MPTETRILIRPIVHRLRIATPGPQGPPGPAGTGSGTGNVSCPDDNTVHQVVVVKLSNGDYQLKPVKVT